MFLTCVYWEDGLGRGGTTGEYFSSDNRKKSSSASQHAQKSQWSVPAKSHLTELAFPMCPPRVPAAGAHRCHLAARPGASLNYSTSADASQLLTPATEEHRASLAFYLEIHLSQECTCAFPLFLRWEINVSVNKCPSIKPALVYFKIKVSCHAEHKNMQRFMWESERILY